MATIVNTAMIYCQNHALLPDLLHEMGVLVFKPSARNVESQGDDVRIRVYRHLNELHTWYLSEGDTQGFTKRFEVNASGGEMFFFTMQVHSTWREFKYDPNAFRVQVYLKK